VKQVIDIKLAFRQAENIARKRSSKAWLMSGILIPRRRVRYLYLCYAYLRWVDNFIDDKTKNFNEKKDFIENQFKLFSNLADKKEVKIKSNEESYLYHFISFAVKKDKPILIKEFGSMIEAMKMDVNRLETDGIFSETELACYITLLNKSMFGLVHNFMCDDDDFDYENLGELLWYAGTLRDFFKDLEDGYVNISREDLENYKININNHKVDENLKIWLREKIPSVLKLLEIEILILKKMPLKIRMFWAFAYPFYLQKILRIKMYNYSYDYTSHKSLNKELKTYLTVLLLGSKTVLRILFR